MNLTVLTVAASVPEWFSEVVAAIGALGVLGAAAGWVRRTVRRVRNPGEAPGGQAGEDREFCEDVLRPVQGGSPQWWKDQQRGKTWLHRWRRRRSRERKRLARQRAERFRGFDEEDEE